MERDAARRAERQRLRWRRSRQIKVEIVRLLIGVAAGYLLVEMIYQWASLYPEHAPNIASYVGNQFLGTFLSLILSERDLTALAEKYPYIGLFCIGFVGGFGSSHLTDWAASIHDKYLATFNCDVLYPVQRAKAFDPLWGSPDQASRAATQWVRPEGGARKKVWDALDDFVLNDFVDGRAANDPRLWTRRSAPRVPKFRWTLLTGRSGSGKTRLAAELARERAQRKHLGGRNGSETSDRWSWWKRWWLRIGAYSRWVWAPNARRENDPLDAGWLINFDENDPSWEREDRKRSDRAWLDRIAKWRPCRPTILLLDDPLKEQTRTIVDTLHHESRDYRYPVRLIVISQAIHDDMAINITSRDIALSAKSQLNSFNGIVTVLSENSCLDEKEIRMIGRGFHLLPKMWHGNDREVDRFKRITRGNPLLVELGFVWMGEGKTIEDMSEDSLLMLRVERIVEALGVAGLGSEVHLNALAAATLAGSDPFGGQALREPILRTFELSSTDFDVKKLAKVFSLDATLQSDRLPSVRPERIGDAFVRHIIQSTPNNYIGPKEALEKAATEKIVTAAWMANPWGTLRSVTRFGHDDSPLGQALRAGPPPDSPIDPVELALAYAKAAVQIPREDWDAHNFSEGTAMLDAARRRIEALAPEGTAANLKRFVDLMDVDNAIAIVRGDTGLTIVNAAAARALSADIAWQSKKMLDTALDLLRRTPQLADRWGLNSSPTLTPINFALAEIVHRISSLPEALRPHPEIWFKRALFFSCRIAPRIVEEMLCAIVDRVGGSAQIVDTSEYVCAVVTAKASSTTAQSHANPLDEVPPLSINANQFQRLELQRARAASILVYARREDAARCLAAVEKVDQIALPFTGERDFELARAQAWRHLAFASLKDLALCLAAVKKVEQIALPFTGERDFELERAQGWLSLAVAVHAESAALCPAIVEKVEQITLPFAGERAFELERTEASSSLAYAAEKTAHTVSQKTRG